MPCVKIQSCIRGFHVYKEVRTPVMEDILICSRESTNLHNPFTVKVLKSKTIVGHLPRSINLVCSLFLERRISIIDKETWDSVVTGDYFFFLISQWRHSHFVNF